MPGRLAIEPIFAVTQQTEKYGAAKKDLYGAFIDLEKTYEATQGKRSGNTYRRDVQEDYFRTVREMYRGAEVKETNGLGLFSI